MSVPAITDFDRYVATPLTNTNWDNNLTEIVNILTSGTAEVTVQSVTTTSGVTVTGALAVTGAIGTTTGIISGDGSGITNLPNNFVDRGDAAAVDITQATMTTNGNWIDWDLSSIVPAGTKAVLIRVQIRDGQVASTLNLRENGNSNAINMFTLTPQVIDQNIFSDAIVSVDTNRVIEYRATSKTWTAIGMVVSGYWK